MTPPRTLTLYCVYLSPFRGILDYFVVRLISFQNRAHDKELFPEISSETQRIVFAGRGGGDNL